MSARGQVQAGQTGNLRDPILRKTINGKAQLRQADQEGSTHRQKRFRGVYRRNEMHHLRYYRLGNASGPLKPIRILHTGLPKIRILRAPKILEILYIHQTSRLIHSMR